MQISVWWRPIAVAVVFSLLSGFVTRRYASFELLGNVAFMLVSLTVLYLVVVFMGDVSRLYKIAAGIALTIFTGVVFLGR